MLCKLLYYHKTLEILYIFLSAYASDFRQYKTYEFFLFLNKDYEHINYTENKWSEILKSEAKHSEKEIEGMPQTYVKSPKGSLTV